jgi:hypothetical protein
MLLAVGGEGCRKLTEHTDLLLSGDQNICVGARFRKKQTLDDQ